MSADKKIVFITGGNTGLGYEVVKALASSPMPYHIIIGCRTPSKGEDAVNCIKQIAADTSSTFSVIETDLNSDASLEKAVEHLAQTYGRVDSLINNGGAQFHAAEGKLTLREAYNATWDTNVSGTHVLTTLAVPLLLKSADPQILFMTSGTSSLTETEYTEGAMYQRLNGNPEKGWPKKADHGAGLIAYRAAKCGLNMLMRDWARVLKQDGVKVWAISPGFLATNLGGAGPEELRKLGAKDPALGGQFIREVVEGKRDEYVGKVIRVDEVQPY